MLIKSISRATCLIATLFMLTMASVWPVNALQTVAEDNVANSWHSSRPHIQVALLSEKNTITPNTKQFIAIEMQPDDEWHTYWRNPGDSGEAPKIEWTASSDNIHFGEIMWPTPEAIPVAHLVNYGYSNKHLLLVPITYSEVEDENTASSLTITADLSWLVCKEDCIPGWATLQMTLPISDKANDSKHIASFNEAREQLPKTEIADASYEINDASIALEFLMSKLPRASGENESITSSAWQVFPFRNDLIMHASPQPQVNENRLVSIILEKSDYFSQATIQNQKQALKFLIKNETSAYHINATPVQSVIENDTGSSIDSGDLLLILGFAFLGGLILNVMPCVLPILSIKALALHQTHHSKLQKIAYLLGVLSCFNIFSLGIVFVQASGEELGWGFHMQSPSLIWLLAFLFTFIALVLLDVFTIGSKLAGLGNGLVAGDSAKSHYFTGLLAVVVASPCTAPFMAAALGVALVSDTLTTFLIFNALALGFALPLSLIFWSNKLREILPKPGTWMLTFKHFLAFPMLFTVAWLSWIFAGQQGSSSQFLLLLALVSFAMCAWAVSKKMIPWLFTSLMLLLAAVPFIPFTDVLVNSSKNLNVNNLNQKQMNAETYSQEKLDNLKQAQRVVLVNMTADWCITCKVNEHVALNTEEVQNALASEGVSYMLGDWTNKNNEILHYLKKYQRAGVPLYVVYAGTHSYQVLPQILSPGIVVDALNQAKKEISYVN